MSGGKPGVMGLLVAFAAGWVIASRTNRTSSGELTRSVRALMESEEFADVVVAARSQAAETLRQVAAVVEGAGVEADGDQDLVRRVRRLIGS